MSETITVYKLFRKLKSGQLAPLFINKKLRVPIGEWMEAEDHPTKGYAHRPGWHCCIQPIAPHLSKKDRVWCLCEAQGVTKHKRPEHQGGHWVLAKRLRVLKEVG